MIELWSNEEVEDILRQLDGRRLPFPKYTVVRNDGTCSLLGSGSSASVYQAVDRNGRGSYAMKVIGFRDTNSLPEDFAKVMSLQKRLCRNCRYIVRIYDFVQLLVKLDDHNRVIKTQTVSGDRLVLREKNGLLLQFIVMENLMPVLRFEKTGGCQLTPDNLAQQQEILNLGRQIGDALRMVHKNGLLHRDVKLENIFYSSKEKCYRLGDFGVAKAAAEGIGFTTVYTKGYGAPEIITAMEDAYDATADIYSFGMVLYVLLNQLRFPGSDTYRVNAVVQYCPGYVLPRPRNGSDALAGLVLQMCRFYPQERPQSMQNVCEVLGRVDLPADVLSRDSLKKTFGALAAVWLFVSVLMVMLWKGGHLATQNSWWILALSVTQLLYFGGQVSGSYSNLPRSAKIFFSRQYQKLVPLMYVLMILLGVIPTSAHVATGLLGIPSEYWQDGSQILRTGVAGLVICILWQFREKRNKDRLTDQNM